jgi:hypothetical protein
MLMRYANCCCENLLWREVVSLMIHALESLVDEPWTEILVSEFLSFRQSPMADAQSITITSPQNILNIDKSFLAFSRSASSMVVCMTLACTFRVLFDLGETVKNVRG